ncbi:SGNH/GDSL hydrolase family protein [Ruania zhangjianzhongii]|uniref:SGNH/GDSL hydrolase family protein n=1 Tax=Ruania zhangjianzhongii TaxID=2603206 RepID=UPI0011C9F34A|nr:SGNH/GDSL hydrolase family protein [Ruania zhangjianzhongii]
MARPVRSARQRRLPTPPALVLLLGLLWALAGCSSPGTEGESASSGTEQTTGAEQTTGTDAATGSDQDELSIAVVGDSITQASATTFAPGELSEDSWVSYAVGDPIELAGGWARWGATTAEMAAHAGPVDADVLVILAGTNDLAVGTETGQVAADLQRIADTVGADQVLLCGVPPIDARPEVVPPFNEFLTETAEANGWAWVDPAAGIRTDGTFAPGMSVDGVHPTQAGATQIGTEVREVLLAEFGSPG